MTKSKIEYLTHVWNFYTGCRHQETGVCTLPCWAKAMAKRFGRSFEPSFNRDIFVSKSPKEPSRIGVCFTGDLFGDWADPDFGVGIYKGTGSPAKLKDIVLGQIDNRPQHQYFFLTKAPWNLHKWGKFPDNAWLGASICNDVMLTHAFQPMLTAQAKNRWLSIEPLLSWGMSDVDLRWSLEKMGIGWVVIGAQTHPLVLPKIEWVQEIAFACDQVGIPVFLKDNLVDGFHAAGIDIVRWQELPL